MITFRTFIGQTCPSQISKKLRPGDFCWVTKVTGRIRGEEVIRYSVTDHTDDPPEIPNYSISSDEQYWNAPNTPFVGILKKITTKNIGEHDEETTVQISRQAKTTL